MKRPTPQKPLGGKIIMARVWTKKARKEHGNKIRLSKMKNQILSDAGPIGNCPVDGEEVYGTKYSLRYKGKQILFCTAACRDDFSDTPEEYEEIKQNIYLPDDDDTVPKSPKLRKSSAEDFNVEEGILQAMYILMDGLSKQSRIDLAQRLLEFSIE